MCCVIVYVLFLGMDTTKLKGHVRAVHVLVHVQIHDMLDAKEEDKWKK